MIEFLKSSAEALVLTIAVELIVARVFGLRSKKELLTIVLVNVITNPLLNYLLMVNGHFRLISQTKVLMLFLEAGIVIVEWRLLVWALEQKANKMLALSAVMNASSFIAGLLLFR
jgi:hypothetical protein